MTQPTPSPVLSAEQESRIDKFFYAYTPQGKKEYQRSPDEVKQFIEDFFYTEFLDFDEEFEEEFLIVGEVSSKFELLKNGNNIGSLINLVHKHIAQEKEKSRQEGASQRDTELWNIFRKTNDYDALMDAIENHTPLEATSKEST